jgi:hypothetical protein
MIEVPTGAEGQDLAPVKVVESIEASREELRRRGRNALGVTGEDDAQPLRRAIRASGVGWYPLLALMTLILIDQFQSTRPLWE